MKVGQDQTVKSDQAVPTVPVPQVVPVTFLVPTEVVPLPAQGVPQGSVLRQGLGTTTFAIPLSLTRFALMVNLQNKEICTSLTLSYADDFSLEDQVDRTQQIDKR